MLIAVLSVNAQQKLTLEECVQTALKNNYDHKNVIFNKEIADKQVSEAYGTSLFPSIKGNVTYDRALKRPEFILEFGGNSQRIKVGSANSLTTGINLEQPLFTGAMFLAVKIAKTFADISQHAVNYSAEELIVKVKQSYYTYVLSKEFVKLARVQLKRAKENAENAKSMYEAGLAPEYDYIKANVQYKNTIPALSSTKTQVRQAFNNLLLIMGVTNDKSNFDVVDSLKFKNLPLPSFEDGIKTAIEKNELIKQTNLEANLKDLSVDYQFTKHFPELSGYGRWSMQAQEEDTRHFNDWRYINSVSVGLVLKIPIFSGGAVQSKVEQAKVELKKAQENLAKIKRSVRNNYENIRLQIKSLVEQVDAYKSAITEAERGYEIARKRFEAGLGTQIEVTNSAVDVTSASVNYLKSVHDYYTAHANLDLILGKTVKEIQY